MQNNHEFTIVTLKLCNSTKSMKNINVVPKDVQRILLSYKILKKDNKQDLSYKKVVLKNLAIFTGKQLSGSLFFPKNTGLLAFNFVKKRLLQGCFPVNITKFLRTPILKNNCERLFESFPA